MKTATKLKKHDAEILKTSNLSNKIISSSAQSRETIPLTTWLFCNKTFFAQDLQYSLQEWKSDK